MFKLIIPLILLSFIAKASPTIDFISNYVIVELDNGVTYIVNVTDELDKNDRDAIIKKVKREICKTNSRYCDN